MSGRLTAFSPFAPEVMADPYPFYAELLEHHPVAFVEEFAVVSRYADVVAALRDPGTFTSTRGNTREDMPAVADTTMITSDPPKHTELRALVNRAFTPKMVAALEPRIRRVSADLIDAAVARGNLDVVRDLAYPLPVTVIAEIMGVDTQRRDDFKRWSDDAIAGLGASGYGDRSRMGSSLEEFSAYFNEVIAQRRRSPRDDLISAMLANADTVPEPGDLVTLLFLLLVAGHETTTNLIGNGILLLLRHPEQLERLRRHPDLLPGYVEEVLRFEPPVQGLYRTTTRATVVAGTAIAPGTKVLLLFAAANRDPCQFPDPDRFDIARRPNLHLAFGSGVHFCLGASLARLEARVATEELLRRLPRLRPAGDGAPEWLLNPTIRGLRRLPVAWN